ncbi:DUF2867 domain-containing protein [Devosia sp. SL43]|uniref:DUF2867 domain-containing protein n=1 Tax=Devosia sp. SL43 TaxID=2806348 RepID=UPI001F25E0DB|nr:DUF2867 domain-containing protein [Devosia sp. SL43]UJW87243.1 DUF2867 domain-containing protein [Devosia sp. SL43]
MAKDFIYPDDGALRRYYADGDFLDGQWVPLPHPAPDAADLTIATFFKMPGWVMGLLALRDGLVSPLGLKTARSEGYRVPTRQEVLDCSYPGVFAVHSATPDEVILGTDDKHLDFRVSILRSVPEDLVAISTWVRPHNILGNAYLATVYPFHRIIVARCLDNAAELGIVAA